MPYVFCCKRVFGSLLILRSVDYSSEERMGSLGYIVDIEFFGIREPGYV